MKLPVMPPVSPMLAKELRRSHPGSYELKWAGFRSTCFRDRDQVELGSRDERPMTRDFPELVAAVKGEPPERCVIDGEIVIATHPNARPERGIVGGSVRRRCRIEFR